MADKPTNKERLKELGEKIEAGIREVFDSGKYAEYLKVMSRFPTYSVNNQMLIRLQRPNATKVAGYNKWQQFERHVKRGEHGITIIAPTPYCDSVGFQEIPGFLPSNPLKNAEMTMEDDYGMIDGIINNGPKATVAELEAQARSGQPISLMDLADAVHREERDKKKSVMEQLRQSPKQERKKTAPKKSAEREL